VRLGRAQELKARPVSMTRQSVTMPSRGDFLRLQNVRLKVAVDAAINIVSEDDAGEFMRDVGVEPLYQALRQAPRVMEQGTPASTSSTMYMNVDVGKTHDALSSQVRVDAVKSICRLLRRNKILAPNVANQTECIAILTDMIEFPYKINLKKVKTDEERLRILSEQREATALVQRIVRSSDEASEILKRDERLRRVLCQVAMLPEFDKAGNEIPISKCKSFNGMEYNRASGLLAFQHAYTKLLIID